MQEMIPDLAFLTLIKGATSGTCGIKVITVENGHCDPSSNPGQGCISFCTNTLEKNMNFSIPPNYGYIVEQTELFNIHRVTSLRVGKVN